MRQMRSSPRGHGRALTGEGVVPRSGVNETAAVGSPPRPPSHEGWTHARAGALLAALLVRRLVPHDDPQRTLGFSPTGLYGQTQGTGLRALGLQTTGALLPDFDTMLADLEHRVTTGGTRSQQYNSLPFHCK